MAAFTLLCIALVIHGPVVNRTPSTTGSFSVPSQKSSQRKGDRGSTLGLQPKVPRQEMYRLQTTGYRLVQACSLQCPSTLGRGRFHSRTPLELGVLLLRTYGKTHLASKLQRISVLARRATTTRPTNLQCRQPSILQAAKQMTTWEPSDSTLS